jgi:precorrin-6A/cobalt-precorrin-6A reductase
MLWLIGGTSDNRTLAQSLDRAALPWLADLAIRGIIDASHPFATEISQQAIAAAALRSIPYLRFERPTIPLEPPALKLPNLAAALCDQFLRDRLVLFTLGVKALPQILPWRDRVAALWVRVLPESVAQAISLGFDLSEVIGQRLPVDPAQERAD